MLSSVCLRLANNSAKHPLGSKILPGLPYQRSTRHRNIYGTLQLAYIQSDFQCCSHPRWSISVEQRSAVLRRLQMTWPVHNQVRGSTRNTTTALKQSNGDVPEPSGSGCSHSNLITRNHQASPIICWTLDDGSMIDAAGYQVLKHWNRHPWGCEKRMWSGIEWTQAERAHKQPVRLRSHRHVCSSQSALQQQRVLQNNMLKLSACGFSNKSLQ
jgi:hypothetical protein